MGEESSVEMLVDFRELEDMCPKSPQPLLPDRNEILRTFEAAIASEKARVKPREVGSPQLLVDYTQLISEEKFDFDLPPGLMSSPSQGEHMEVDEDEVFFGPVEHTKKCVATVVGEAEPEVEPMAPLTAAEMVDLFKEAHEVAYRITAQNNEKKNDAIVPVPPFILSPLMSPSPIKKHTRKGTCTLDSPEESETEPEPERAARSENLPGKRKGTFTLESPAESETEPKSARFENPPGKMKGTFTLDSPAESETEPKFARFENPPGKRKGIYTLDSPDRSETRLGKVKPGPQPLSLLRKGLGIGSLYQRRAVSPRSNLRAPLSSRKRRSLSAGKLKMNTTEGIERRSIPNVRESIIPSKQHRIIPKVGTTNKQRSISPSNCNVNVVNKSQTRPLRGLPRPTAGQSGLQKPSATLPLRPSSGLKAPSTKPETAAVPTRATQSNLKGPRTKMELLKTGTLQKLSLGTNRGKQSGPSGPLKALGGHSGLKVPRVPLKATVSGVPQQRTPPRNLASSNVTRSIRTTTVKQDRKVQPKRLAPLVSRSGLAPDQKRPRQSGSATTAIDPMSPPQLHTKGTPPVSRPRIQRTPINKENVPKVKRSIWSPVRRLRPLSREDEFTQCTKRTTQTYQ